MSELIRKNSICDLPPSFDHTIRPVTQRFVLKKSTKDEIYGKTPKFGFNGLGEVVFRRTYSRNNEDWHDVVIRVIEGVMSIRKEHFYRASLRWVDDEWQQFAREMALSLFDMEWLPPGRGLWMMGTEFTYTRGAMALNNCFSKDTKFWTSEGLKSFEDFQNGDKVIIRGKDKWVSATIKSFGFQKLWELKVQKKNEIKTIFTTSHHRWIVSKDSYNFEIKITKDLEKNICLKSTNDPWKVYSVSETEREEEVWCVVEPENEEFTLECGILTKNCAATDTSEDLVLSAEWTMDGLMNGVGVGFTTTWRGTAEVPNKSDTETFVIPDSREGWVHSLIKLLCAYVNSPRYGKNKFPTFDYSLIRPSGLPIKGFGGVSSGPEPLMKLHKRVEEYLDNFCQGYIIVDNKSKPYNHTRLIADIFNAIGACVVAGNVRRCLPKSAMVHTSRGLIPIAEIQIEDKVLTMNGYEKVANKFKQGKQKLIKIITKDGDFKCTPNHRMAVCTFDNNYEWKNASTLEGGDKLISSRFVIDGEKTCLPPLNYIDITIPELDEDMAWFIGLFQHIGHVDLDQMCISGSVNVMNKVYEQLKRFRENLCISSNEYKPENKCMIYSKTKGLVWYFYQHIKQKNTVRTPDYILKAKPSIRLAYVSGMADGTDGCKINSIDDMILVTENNDFAHDVQNVLYSCGIESRLKKDFYSDSQVFKVILTTKHSETKFNSIPQLHKKIKVTELDNDENDECNYSSVEVVKIIDDIEEETYDIEVENRHEFFCNGYLTHNSAEICLGDVDDDTFINLKNYTQNPERGEIGWMSNNSVVLQADHDYNDFTYIPEMAARIRDNGEPGMINLYNVQKFGRYGKEMEDKASLVNPCFSEDTKIAVADGRGYVTIKELAEEGKDVPVYSIDKSTGEVSIQWGRHPRITGYNKKLIRVHFSGNHKGEYMDVTPNHKIILNDGREIEAQELKKGDSLPRFKKSPNGKNDYIVVKSNNRRLVEHRLIKKFQEKDKFYENYDKNKFHGCCHTCNVVVHHKDENKSNNHPDNLEITSFEEHNRHHNKDFIGEGNPMYGKKHKESTKKLISEKAKDRCEDPEYIAKMSEAQKRPDLVEKSSKRMSKQKAIWDEKECDRQVEEAKRTGLRFIRNEPTKLLIVRTCENEKCKKDFQVKWTKREQAYCSKSCSNTNKEHNIKRKEGQAKKFEEKAKENFHKQAMIYKDLEESGNPVTKKQWEQACKEKGISCRFNKKSNNPWIASDWKEFKQMVVDHNHRVSHIEELDGEHTVYNITVDKNHTLAVVTKTSDSVLNLSGVFVSNCGEIALENYELCNLAESFPPRCQNSERFFQSLKFATFYSSTVSLLPTHRPETNAVIARNRRIGISISGIAQWASGEVPKGWGNLNYTTMTRYLRTGYKIVRDYNKLLAEQAGVPVSVRVTTVKPSGSISLLAGVTPGVHYPVSRYAIRRMRIGKDSPLVKPLIEAGIPHEDDSYSDNTLVFEFVIDHGNVRPCQQVSPWEQFSLVAMMQRCYADNCVSATIYFDKEKDGQDVEKLLAMYIPILKSVSMLPHSGHGYKQAPYEPIDEETYNARKNSYKKPDFNSIQDNVPIGSKFCSGDNCEV